MYYKFSTFVRKIVHNKKIILVNSKTGQWIRMSDTVYQIIDLAVQNEYSYDDLINKLYDDEDRQYISNKLNNLIELKLLVGQSEIPTIDKVSVLLELTRRCNLNCTHCCVNANTDVAEDLSLANIKMILSNIVNIHPNTISLTGGEPLFRKDFFEIINYLRNRYDGQITLLTNGTLINRKNVIDLVKKVDQIDISIDGVDEETSTLIRGKGVFTKVIENVKLLKDNNFNNITLSIIIADKNKHLLKEFLELNKRLATKPILRQFTPIGRGKINNPLFSDGKKSNHIEEYFTDEIMNLEHTKKFTACNCSAGKEVFYIDYKGDIYPCHWFTNGKYNLGNALSNNLEGLAINTKTVLQKLSNFYPDKFEKCKNCDVNLFCWPCPGELMLSANDSNEFDEVCKKMKPILYKHIWGE